MNGTRRIGRIRSNERGGAHPVLLGILLLITFIVGVVFFFVFPALAVAILLIIVGFLLTVFGGLFLPGVLKAIGVVGGIIVIGLGAVLAVVAVGAGTLGL